MTGDTALVEAGSGRSSAAATMSRISRDSGCSLLSAPKAINWNVVPTAAAWRTSVADSMGRTSRPDRSHPVTMSLNSRWAAAAAGGVRPTGVAEHQAVKGRMSQAERDVHVPAQPQVLRRIATPWHSTFALEVATEAVGHDLVEKPVLVAEVVIQRRGGDIGFPADLPRRHGLRADQPHRRKKTTVHHHIERLFTQFLVRLSRSGATLSAGHFTMREQRDSIAWNSVTPSTTIKASPQAEIF